MPDNLILSINKLIIYAIFGYDDLHLVNIYFKIFKYKSQTTTRMFFLNNFSKQTDAEQKCFVRRRIVSPAKSA